MDDARKLGSKINQSRFKVAGRKVAREVTAIGPIRGCLRVLSQAGMLPSWVWKRLPVETTFYVSLPGGAGFAYRASANDLIGRALYWKGVFESHTIGSFLGFAQRSRLFLDIGAHSGFYTLLACATNPSLRVLSFEPVPHIYDRLCENIRLNAWESRCHPYKVAVSNFVGRAKFHVPFLDFPTSSSLNAAGFRGIPGSLMEVNVTTIDSICDQPTQVDLVKIDVEGFEDYVLKGMQRVLTDSKPAMIVECLPDGPYKEIQKILKPMGYCFFHLRESGPIPRAEIVPGALEWNYACLPESRVEWLGKVPRWRAVAYH